MDRIGILVVDPDASARKEAAELLEWRGYSVTQADGLSPATELLRARKAQAIIADIDTDPSAGLAALAKVREAHAGVPVVLLTRPEASYLPRLGRLDVLHCPKPADVDVVCMQVRRALAAGRPPCDREPRVAELMVPVSSYSDVRGDAPIEEITRILFASMLQPRHGKIFEHGHRTVLVHDRRGRFLGCIRLDDILHMVLPASREDASQAFGHGMFVERCRRLKGVLAADLLGEQRFVDIEAPLLEAAHIIVIDGLINIPVLDKGQLVGVLTDRAVLVAMCEAFGGC